MQPALRTFRAGLRTAWGSALAIVYPPTCVGCGAATADPHALCPACWSRLRLIEQPFCPRLGTPFGVDLGIGLLVSPRAIAEPPVFERNGCDSSRAAAIRSISV